MSVNAIRIELDARMAEFDAFRSFAGKIERPNASLSYELGTGSRAESVGLGPIAPTLRASLITMLYNIVECTVTTAFESLFQALKIQKVSLASARDEIRSTWCWVKARNLRDGGVDKLRDGVISAVKASIECPPIYLSIEEVKKLFQGNLDADLIRKLAAKVAGIEFRSSASARGGPCLADIVRCRNSLTHGEKRFSEIGADYDLDRIRSMRNEVRFFLLDFLGAIDLYIANASYLRPVPPTEDKSSPPVEAE